MRLRDGNKYRERIALMVEENDKGGREEASSEPQERAEREQDLNSY